MVMVSLVVIMGCNNNRKTVTRFTPEGNTAEATKAPETVIKVKDSEPVAVSPTPIELKTDEKVAQSADSTPFDVTSLEKNLAQDTKGYHLIEGTTPASTSKILVNDYPLSKYKAGETKWSYIAAVSLGNLKKGDNKFTVKALDTAGTELGSKAFTITYKGVESAKLASTGMDSISLSALLALLAIGFMGFRGLAKGNV